MRVLAVDLDGTLLAGSPTDRGNLLAALARHPEITVVFVTGRSLSSVREVLHDPLTPQPRWIIADVGASIINGVDFSPVEQIQTQLRIGWPGAERIRDALRQFPTLSYQDVAQDGRCSFYLAPEHLTQEITNTVQALGCAWLYSADRYFDVLPAHASKGNALAALARHQSWQMSSIVVAGDTMNDLSMFELGAHGVIVGNAEPALLAGAPDESTVYRSDQVGAAGILSGLQRLGWVQQRYQLVIGYHRPPVLWTDDGWSLPASPNGILPTLRGVLTENANAIWTTAFVRRPSQARVRLDDHNTGLPLSFVPMSLAEWSRYFHQACKDILWPILMSQPGRLRFDEVTWRHYQRANERFADHIDTIAATGATIWLHDYNLWLVPGLLRHRRPDLRLGLFHHTPFPPADVFTALPTAAELHESLSCLDWVGFHTEFFAEHFRQFLGHVPSRPCIGVHPLGVDRKAIAALARSRKPIARTAGDMLVVAVERLDYIKAPVQKIEAIDLLLTQNTQLRGRLRFRLICPPPEPGITAYESTRHILERRIAEVNQAWATHDWQPVEYVPRGLPFAEVVDHYVAADVLWVTSLQDGMNLTAKEFVAAQAAVDGAGALVLSRYTGAATQLGAAAFLTDPYSITNLADVLYQAVTLAPRERRIRMRRLSELLGDKQPADWATEITDAIAHSYPQPLSSTTGQSIGVFR